MIESKILAKNLKPRVSFPLRLSSKRVERIKKMKNEEKRNNESKFTETSDNTLNSDRRNMFEMMAECCNGMSGPTDCRSMMAKCMRKCRWCLLIPVIIGALLLLLGYVLDAEITRMLWMTFAGFVILMCTFGFLMMSLIKRKSC